MVTTSSHHKHLYTSDIEAEHHVNLIAVAAVPLALRSDNIKDATKKDIALQKVIEIIHNNQWKHAMQNPDNDVKAFIPIRNELSVTKNNLILKSNKTVIPESLKELAVNIAHAGHQGIIKPKKLIRKKVWFPGIDKAVEQAV